MKNFLAMAKSGGLKSPDELHSILDVLPVPVSWATLGSGDILFMNQAFKKTFGYCEADFAKVSDWIDRVYVGPGNKERAKEAWLHSWTAGGEGIEEVDTLEIDIRCADGRTVIVSHRGILLRDYGIGVATFEDITERMLAERELRASLLLDPLTQIGNRRALHERWHDDMVLSDDGNRNLAAVLMVDLDHFKPVNDNLGHKAGDEVLRMVAKRLSQSVRESDLVVRMGGDEFVILLTNISDQNVAEKICHRLEAAFQAPFTVNGTLVNLGVSVGASLYPRDGGELSMLLQKADEALYDIKRNGKGGWNWCSPSEITVPNFVI
ncbi:sensor domain-containing diguanylate cyclase [Agrobacterium larrymoorei]|uniref:Sensor domain-containing diguanylate cyclase n=1 Tax=Agrobacterium larrymoorei TaxID=160699 RepID=A0AAF0H8T3_9HYPH|nr:sensor domain-containing diguanylate cyclase [Agrobacterium larrymoorei]WHA39965.1 sensor domain-containing diguanylate cyclase [Agrobacterium larrymoorei]